MWSFIPSQAWHNFLHTNIFWGIFFSLSLSLKLVPFFDVIGVLKQSTIVMQWSNDVFQCQKCRCLSEIDRMWKSRATSAKLRAKCHSCWVITQPNKSKHFILLYSVSLSSFSIREIVALHTSNTNNTVVVLFAKNEHIWLCQFSSMIRIWSRSLLTQHFNWYLEMMTINDRVMSISPTHISWKKKRHFLKENATLINGFIAIFHSRLSAY